MKIAHISHTDAGAGAGRAAYRIHHSLRELGEESLMFVSAKRTSDPTVISVSQGKWPHIRAKASEYFEAKTAQRAVALGAGHFSLARMGHFNPAREVRIRNADIVNLYWISGGFVTPEALSQLRQPIVWRLSDIWPFTGGCHYPGSCERYTQHCGECPQLATPSPQDSSQRLLARKREAWQTLNLTIAAPSEWIASLARKSTLFSNRRIEVIPTGVDTQAYHPRDRAASRAAFGIPQDKKVILFGAMDTREHRKGGAQLVEALRIMAQTPLKEQVVAVVFGSSTLSAEQLPVPSVFLGRLREDASLAAAYSSADLVVVPSLEDNLPNVALEAIACGTPVVGFDVCGMKDIIHHQHNGALAQRVDPAALADAICYVLHHPQHGLLGHNARAHAVSRFSLVQQAQSYLQLYRDLVSR